MNCPTIHALRLSALALALLAASAMPAFAADEPCRVWNAARQFWGKNPTLATSQGSEHGDSNTTCAADAAAYEEHNNASGAGSNALGGNDRSVGVGGGW